jgi:hypothetical protein
MVYLARRGSSKLLLLVLFAVVAFAIVDVAQTLHFPIEERAHNGNLMIRWFFDQISIINLILLRFGQCFRDLQDIKRSAVVSHGQKLMRRPIFC